jgi:hypothetical protein
MYYTLMIYTVVAMAGQNSFSMVQAHDWRQLTTHYTLENCVNAAKTMGISAERFRCIPSK